MASKPLPPIDMSEWADKLYHSAIRLVTTLDIWIEDPTASRTVLIKKPNPLLNHPNSPAFRVVAAVGLEYAVKALCVARHIDIFKTRKATVGPYDMPIEADRNPWLASIFSTKGYKVLGHIDTVPFHECIKRLRDNLKSDPPPAHLGIAHSTLLNDVQTWKDNHRNRDCHVALPAYLVDQYDGLLRTYNQLLTLFVEHPKT